MKIRGTPAHIAEKYITLSRDANTNGDPVLAENYLQHAEHYNRIILAYRDTQAQHASEQQGGHHPQAGNGQQRQPVAQDQPFDSDGDVDPAEAAQPDTNGPAPQRRQPPRNREPRQPDGRGEGRAPRQPRGRKPRAAAAAAPDAQVGDDAPRRTEKAQAVPEHEQPEFLRRSIRRPRRTAEKPAGDAVTADESSQD